jgi:Holliday junction resolvasome RuvABC endonuclease subunit
MVMKRKSIHHPTIAAYDPSITAWGWAILTYQGEILDSGVICTKPSPKKLRIRKGDDKCRRIEAITSILVHNIKRYNVQFIVSEQPHGSQSSAAAVMVGITLGIIITIGDCFKIPIEWYLEADAKMFLLGKRSATKKQGIAGIQKVFVNYDLGKFKYEQEAVADALAVYLAARGTSPTIKMLSKL